MGKTARDQAEAVDLMLAKYEICLGLFHGFDWSHWTTGTPSQRLSLLPAAQEHILGQEDGKNRLLRTVMELSQAFALAVPHDEAIRIRDDVGFFQAVRAVLAKSMPGEQKTDEELDHAIRQTGLAGELVVGNHAGADHDEIGGKHVPCIRLDFYGSIGVPPNIGDRRTEADIDPTAHMFFENDRAGFFVT
jgi:hypothetical protein